MLGEWLIHGSFQQAQPFPHIVIDNMFSDQVISGLLEEFGNPTTEPAWKRYWNPIEKKYALNDFSSRPFTKSVFDFLQTDEFVERIAELTSIPLLESDPYLHGAGLHYHPREGKLDMHLDYSIHPLSGLERRVNLIVYLNEEWDAAWGGALELWDAEFTHCVKSILPTCNRAVLFQTTNISYHGLPHPIKCPETTGRKSLAVYYVSPIETTSVRRLKAEFRPLPDQVVNEHLARLYEIRKTRLIQESDLWPGWNSENTYIHSSD